MSGSWDAGIRDMLQYIIELVCISAVWAPLLYLEWYGTATVQGFFCADTSLQYPYRESTMTASIMYPVSCIFPFLGVIINIYCGWKTNSLSVKSVYRQVLVFAFGFGLAHLLVDVGKFYGGRLRPHFFDVCSPDWSQIDCSVGYITNYTCLGSNKTRLRKMRLSFPSAHGSCICYGVVFFIVYIQSRNLKKHLGVMPATLLQAAAVCLAFYTCITRITDNKHHATDVIAGACGGSAIGYWMAALLQKLPEPLSHMKKKS
ncbi:phospholipid phosphatase 1-like isoform X1 [Haliotis rufescens]|uniref:phospholipid phosphatase 1-like isoform X1 n=1 Tax=Haliotis rufescens TaxID=6454 RepID=UPI00201E93B2|nr:phospholipid phosphatase 1-like isoform X1 [Haliotis rufescens]